jgi:hypothetical protein
VKDVKRQEPKSHARSENPSPAISPGGNGSATEPVADGQAREARLREAAYERFERRGRTHGHDLDDWLSAEAQLRP